MKLRIAIILLGIMCISWLLALTVSQSDCPEVEAVDMVDVERHAYRIPMDGGWDYMTTVPNIFKSVERLSDRLDALAGELGYTWRAKATTTEPAHWELRTEPLTRVWSGSPSAEPLTPMDKIREAWKGGIGRTETICVPSLDGSGTCCYQVSYPKEAR